jgi:hypothetical protein
LKVSFIYPNKEISGYASSLIDWCKINEKIDVESLIIINQKKRTSFIDNLFHFFKYKILKILFRIDDLLALYNKNLKLIKTNNQFDYSFLKVKYFNYSLSSDNKELYDYILNSNIELIVNFSNIEFNKKFKLKIITSSDFFLGLEDYNLWANIFNYVFSKKDSLIFEIFEETKNGRNILVNGYIQTNLIFSVNRINLLCKKLFYTKILIENFIETNNFNSIIQKRKESSSYNQKIRIESSVVYLLYIFLKLFYKFFRKILGFENRWGVAFSNNNKGFNFFNANKFKANRMHFIADPFLFSFKNRTFCFVEEYSYKFKKGFISLYEINESKSKYLGKVLEENFHLSFPYVFKYQNDIYMCPESSQNNDIRLYKSIEFPFKWKLEKILMNNICAADTLIFEKNSMWWMFTNIDPLRTGENCSEFHIFYSNSPLSNEWKSHKMNPIIIDSQISRNAGLIFDNNNYYRVRQKQGFDSYGKSSSIAKIIDLSVNNFEEKFIRDIKPVFFKNLTGTHHVSKGNKYTAFDYLKISNKFL